MTQNTDTTNHSTSTTGTDFDLPYCEECGLPFYDSNIRVTKCRYCMTIYDVITNFVLWLFAKVKGDEEIGCEESRTDPKMVEPAGAAEENTPHAGAEGEDTDEKVDGTPR